MSNSLTRMPKKPKKKAYWRQLVDNLVESGELFMISKPLKDSPIPVEPNSGSI